MGIRIRIWLTGVAVCVVAFAVSLTAVRSAIADPMLGFEASSALVSNADATPDLLAGSHPYALTTAFKVNTRTDPEGRLTPEGGDLKELVAELPPGLSIDPVSVAPCGAGEFATINPGTDEDGCPAASAVGVVALEDVAASTLSERKVSRYPLYELAPPHTAPGLFGFTIGNVPVYLTLSVRSTGDYGLTVTIVGIPQDVHVLGGTVTFWGVPAQSVHDAERGDCIQSHGTCPAGVSPEPLLTLPTQCLTAPAVRLRAASWQEPAQFSALATDPILGGASALTGCEALDFSPAFHTQVESSTADAPTGVKFQMQLPQDETPSGRAEADIREATVTLPPGMTLNSSRAANLVGCPLEGPQAIGLGSSEPGGCPEASKLGNVKIRSPLLAQELSGGVYLAQQGNLPGNGTNPFNSLLAVYIVAEGSGVTLKLPGEVSANPETGQLTMHVGADPITGQTFAPQLPFESIELEFVGGEEGVFVTPTSCGSYVTSASLVPWSSEAAAALSDESQVTQRCTNALSPSFSAGTIDRQANAYSTFATTIARQDGEQELKNLSLTNPPGLIGTLKGVALCPEPQASLGTCGADSLIGEASATLGAGPDPFTLTGGRVYLTGPYGGGPFGLSIVESAIAGPFNLGPGGGPLVIRAAVRIDPITAQITITIDPSGPYSIPSILQGIVTQIRSVTTVINRPHFIFNPSKCAAQHVTGVVTSTQGATANVSAPFEATNCASLPFSPKIRASTVGRFSKANGIGLDVKLVEGVAGEANAQSVKLELPKQLPSRLTTLQQACLAAVFATNPASCPSGSIVGTATAVTPILPVALTGPAYFVSQGGAKFPELVVVLQGYGVTVELHGETFISKAGITSSTFAQVPDVPVASFELRLPAAKNSALTASRGLCGSDLRTPTTIVAQNGVVIKESPKVAIGGCRPAIRVLRHRVRGAVATITVKLPSAGTLLASGRRLSRSTRKVKEAATVAVRLRVVRSEQRVLARHRRRRLKVAVELRFIPTHGSKLASHVTVILR
jgi:hypothetical protein